MKIHKYLGCLFLTFLTYTYAQPLELLKDSTSEIDEEISISSGTGFLVSEDGYIITSHHIIDEAKNVSVEISNQGNMKEYVAKIIAEDIENDLAVLKIENKQFRANKIPYEISNNDAELGESVFTLGYPMVETMGKAIKLSNGIISSESGFMGNDHSYQISVPINPGNSGGPLFDEKGNLIGVIKSIYSGAENVAYAIKSKHVNDLCSAFIIKKEINMSNTKRAFVDQVRSLKDLVCLVKAVN